MLSKKIVVFFLMISLMTSLFCEEQRENKPSMFVFTMGPLGMLNLHDNSAPSPLLFSGGFGAQIEIKDKISIAPHLSFFANYYLVDENEVYPAEIEHRRAYAPSFLLDIPVTYDTYFNNSILRMGGGISFLLRYAFVADDTDSTVPDDVKLINSLFWKNMQFIYPAVQVSWDFVTETGFATGVGLKVYAPLGSLISNGSLQNGMISLSARFIPGT